MLVPLLPQITSISLPTYENAGTINDSSLLNNAYTGSREFYVSVTHHNILGYVIIGGMVVKLLILKISEFTLKKYIGSKLSHKAFNTYKTALNVNAELYISKETVSPLSFGIIHKKVVIPHSKLNNSEFKAVILHELLHHKHHDILVNRILNLMSIIYWFNPFVSMAIENIRLGMEMYCDYSVIRHMGSSREYGNIILRFASANSHLPIHMANHMVGTHSQLKKRITKISQFGQRQSKVLNKFLFCLLISVSLVFSVCINSFGYTSDYCFSHIKSKEIDLSAFFRNNHGTFVLYNLNADEYIIYNKTLAYKRVSPDSTYKIPLALKALESGIITVRNSKMDWNGKKNPFPQWDRNQDLSSAMKYSVNWYFQNIDKALCKSEITDYLKSIDYGNKNVISNKDYWLESSLKISPVEQTIFLKKLIKNDYGFKKENLSTVMDAIKTDNGLYGKTGSGMVNGKINNGWFIGFLQKDKNTYVFATRLENKDGTEARKITYEILNSNILIE